MKAYALLTALLVVFAWATSPARANSGGMRFCAEHDSITDKLGSKYNEQRSGMGLVGSSGIVELFTAKSGTWTIVVTQVDGTSCIVAAGNSWADYARKPKLSGL
jgi:hypothetical protein